MTAARHLRVSGKVQGVFYRAWTVEAARRLGLVGWVRNLRDGTVEAWVQGSAGDIAQLINQAHDGPPRARVDRVEASEARPDPGLASFDQRPTA